MASSSIYHVLAFDRRVLSIIHIINFRPGHYVRTSTADGMERDCATCLLQIKEWRCNSIDPHAYACLYGRYTIVLYILEYLCFALLVDSHSLLYHHDPPRPFTIQLSFNHQMGDRLSMEELERERERAATSNHTVCEGRETRRKIQEQKNLILAPPARQAPCIHDPSIDWWYVLPPSIKNTIMNLCWLN